MDHQPTSPAGASVKFRRLVPPHYSLSHPALQKQFELSPLEESFEGKLDPIGDETFHAAPQLIHRYRNRALFMPTEKCPVHCRYCFRRNHLEQDKPFLQKDFEKTLAYLKAHPEIEELIFTGGDPLMLSDSQTAFYLKSFSTLKSLKFLRFHTRTPVILPERLTNSFLSLFKQEEFDFTFVIHSNHKAELSENVQTALKKLSSKFRTLSQTVLLKEVNDNPSTLEKLFRTLGELKVLPYLLHHPDRVQGAMHFYLGLEEGRKIYHELPNLLPGWLIPKYVIDVPDGGGKVSAVNPEGFSYSGQLLNRQGDLVSCPEKAF